MKFYIFRLRTLSRLPLTQEKKLAYRWCDNANNTLWKTLSPLVFNMNTWKTSPVSLSLTQVYPQAEPVWEVPTTSSNYGDHRPCFLKIDILHSFAISRPTMEDDKENVNFDVSGEQVNMFTTP